MAPAPAAPQRQADGGRERRGRRDSRRDAKPSLTDVLPPAKRVAVPSRRGGLDDELEADLEAALAGVEVEDLLAGEAAGRVDAPLEPGTRVTGTVLAVGDDTAFIDTSFPGFVTLMRGLGANFA